MDYICVDYIYMFMMVFLFFLGFSRDVTIQVPLSFW